MNTVEKNSKPSNELKKALYSMLPDAGIIPRGRYLPVTPEEDKFGKIDVRYNTDKGIIAVQLRSYGDEYPLNGFAVRDSPLVNKNELELLKDGSLDEVYFAFAKHQYAPSNYGQFKFLKVKLVQGKYLRRDCANVVGERLFEDGNHVTYIADPKETVLLRDWH
jgi:hypothetical protein